MIAGWLGLHVPADQLTFLQMSLRAAVVFVTTLIVLRLGHRRFLAQLSSFDAIVAFILASTLARAVNGSSAFVPTLGCGFVIIALHRALSALTQRFPRFGDVVKGRPDTVFEGGRFLDERLRAQGVSRRDVLEEARLTANTDNLSRISRATLERNGEVSIVLRDRD